MKPVQVEKEGLPKPMLMLPGKCPAPNSPADRVSITAAPFLAASQLRLAQFRQRREEPSGAAPFKLSSTS